MILGVAPLFHITGSIGHVALSLLTGATLVLTYRFDPALALETIRDEQVTFTIGSITVFIALMNAPGADSVGAGLADQDLLRRSPDPAQHGHRPSRRCSASTSTTSTG